MNTGTDLNGPPLGAATYQGFRGAPETVEPPKLSYLLDIVDTAIPPHVRSVVDTICAEEAAAAQWRAFSFRLAAFKHIQDILWTPFYETDDFMRMFHVHYFYYESRRLLREAVLSSLNGLAAASSALARPILEFALLHNYYVRVTNARSDYGPVAKYFRDGIKPSWSTLLRLGIADSAFSRPIRFRVQQHLTGLSDSCAHPYHPRFAIGSREPVALEALMSWYLIDMILECALWVYYVNYPMLFFPIDFERRFGYNGPVGLFIDETGGCYVRRSLSPSDHSAFAQHAASLEETQDVLRSLDSHPLLTDEQIVATWNPDNGPFPGLFVGYCQTMAQLRTMRLVWAFPPEQLSGEVNPRADLESTVRSYSGWQKMASTSVRRRR